MNEKEKEDVSFTKIQIEERKPVTLIQSFERRKDDRRKKEENSMNWFSKVIEFFCYGFAVVLVFSFFLVSQIQTYYPLWQNMYILILVPFFIGVGLFFQSEKYSD